MINWFNEEGCRFKPSMMGSSVFTGKISAEQVLETTDPHGVTVREALEAIGTIGDFSLDVAGYVELHIEQGRSLDDAGIKIGLVESTWGANKYEFTVQGEQAHTGSTVIADRQDALFAASSMIVAARDVADMFTDDDGMVITSCGEISVFPNSPVVVASEVKLLIDVRATDEQRLADADAELFRRFAEVEERSKCEIVRGAEHIWGRRVRPPRARARRIRRRLARSVEAGRAHPRRPRLDKHEGRRADDHAVRAERRRHHPQRGRVHDRRGHGRRRAPAD